VNIIITNEDVAWTEDILLSTGEHFSDEQKAAITSLETKDVIACPGSGKTTALIAKLLILSKQMPLENNKGICVLTHTNVAINEIKSHASFHFQKLFNYPNHFGTIQSFVDKYLAIPAYINNYNRRPLFINNDIYFNRMERFRKYLGKETNAFCYKSGQKNYPYSLNFEDFAVNNNVCSKIKLNLNDAVQKKHYISLLRLKKQILEDGILSYNDAYYLALKFIEIYPDLKNLFSKRFSYVFIDEMQDSSTTQSILLNEVFNHNIVIQKIGDLNQAIFDYDDDGECGWTVDDTCSLCITGSKRFSNSIASKVEKLCVNQQTITGNGRQNEITPVIIVYDDNSIEQVLNKFGEIIIQNNLHQLEKKIFKAVGWRGTPHNSERTIPSYWDGYSKGKKEKKTEFSNLKSYIIPQSDIFSSGVNIYKKRLIEAILKCLRIAEVKDNGVIFTEKKLYRYISENDRDFYNDFRVRLAKWCLPINGHEEVLEEMKRYLTNEFIRFFGYPINDELTNFINSSSLESNADENLQNKNIYNYSSETATIEIEISTIHAVKGETHIATCYLETFFYEYDIKRIISYLTGVWTKPTQKRIMQNLKMAFVGMSRPSHLLCMAVHCNSISGQEEALRCSGWNIVNCTN